MLVHARWARAITSAKTIGRSVAVTLTAQLGQRLDDRQIQIVSAHLPTSLRGSPQDNLETFDLHVEDLGRLLRGHRRTLIVGGMDANVTLATAYPRVCGTAASRPTTTTFYSSSSSSSPSAPRPPATSEGAESLRQLMASKNMTVLNTFENWWKLLDEPVAKEDRHT